MTLKELKTSIKKLCDQYLQGRFSRKWGPFFVGRWFSTGSGTARIEAVIQFKKNIANAETKKMLEDAIELLKKDETLQPSDAFKHLLEEIENNFSGLQPAISATPHPTS